MEQYLFWVWLAEKLGAQSRDFRHLVMTYGGAYELFHMNEDELEQIKDVTPRTKQRLAQKDLEGASAIIAKCKKKQIGILPFDHPSYPKALRDIDKPPIVLYYRGTLPNFDEHLGIGMVGTRRMSRYGMYAAHKFAYELAGANVLVVSGMATGIDGVAAAAAIRAGGKTVAVLGCGVDVLYPKHHARLMKEIETHGVLLSEYPPGTRPNQYQFPARNRIISGMTQGTVVVEAGMRSGSLITAKEALLQGKQVYAVPANIGSEGAEGTNALLHAGVRMVLSTEDILSHYRLLYKNEIDDEGLEEASKHSRADLHALAEFGVIELIPAKEEPPAPQYEVPRPKKKAEKKKTEPIPTAKKKTESAEMNETKMVSPSRPTPNNLTPIQLAILQAMPDGKPVTAEALAVLRYPYGELIGALTMLEIYGLVQKLPGAFYLKA